ncbi:MAG: HDOD domain-containing protein [Armatimonadetes bacterium]|nr:HDOD domain-containing protein [Armatimonadota bacterium]
MVQPHFQEDSAFYMARQPIYDRNMQLVAYELLYRRGNAVTPPEFSSDDEVAALANVLIEVGLDRLVGKTRAFVNVPQSLLSSEALRLLPPKRVTLEILENTVWTEEVEAQIKDLKALGYQVALDDYVFESRHQQFLKLVDLVKVDMLGVPPGLDIQSSILKLRRPGQQFLAEKVETHAQFQKCLAMGFNLFQGYFFAKPKTIRGTGVRTNQSMSISLLAKIQDPNTTMHELENLIVSNVALGHKVLRLVNCVANGLTKRVDSIQQALMFLGTAKIRTMASLAVITSIPGKPSELYRLAMIRAKFCEAAARYARFNDPEKHFTVGLFSVLDALTDTPMNDILGELPLAPDVIDALRGDGEPNLCKDSLQYVLQVEHGAWEQTNVAFRDVPANAYPEAVEWAREQERSLAS